MKRFLFINTIIIISALIGFFTGSKAYFGAKYEPPDGRIIHGLGQYISIFYTDAENWQLVSDYQNSVNEVPVIYSAYAYIDPLINFFDNTDFQDITNNHGYPYILVVGLSLMDASYISTGQINIPVQDILNGNLDNQIIQVAQRLKNVNAPVYLRPGFEFGENNSGIHNDPDLSAADFKNIWIHIYNIFQQENVLNVAWIWNTVNPNKFNYMNWYPGDQYVDWWGINYFTSSQISNADNFLNDAAAHQKPVMVCESCPIQNGGTTNAANWNNWFIPYFNKLANQPHIKGFIYINDPWDKSGFFDDWPDSRINSNSFIQANYSSELQDNRYIQMSEYLSNPGIITGNTTINDTIPPNPVGQVMINESDKRVQLNWKNPVSQDLAGIQIVRRADQFPQTPDDGLVVFTSLDSTFTDINVQNNHTYYYALFAYDTVLNFSKGVKVKATPHFLNNTDVIINSTNKKNQTFVSAFPNPFNNQTSFAVKMPFNGNMNLKIYNVAGQIVEIITDSFYSSGSYTFKWQADQYASGLYFAVLNLTADNKKAANSNRTQVHKIFLLK
ncbi:MAG: glycosyl hydrolase [Calditrichia bacterium]